MPPNDYSKYDERKLRDIVRSGGVNAQKKAASELEKRGVKGIDIPARKVATPSNRISGGAAERREQTTPTTAQTTTQSVASTAGITVGQYEDYRAMARTVLRQLGFDSLAEDYWTMDPTEATDKLDEIVTFARGGFDLAGIASFFQNDPKLQAINPGLKYGMSREDYFATREGTEEAYEQRFGKTGTLDETRRRAQKPQEVGPAQAEPDWMKQVFQERFTPEQTAEVFNDYFRRTGRAPTAEEIGTYRTRSTQRYGRTVEPSYTPPHIREDRGERPKSSELGGRPTGSGVFGRTR